MLQTYTKLHSYPIIKGIIITAEKQRIIYVVHITAEKPPLRVTLLLVC